MSKIVYGNYTIANAIGSIVGYATQEDFSIQETADSDNKVFGGVTRMETYDNHGKTASGTVALTDAQKAERIKIGHRIQIVQPDGTTRYFIVDQWDIDADTATGGAVASVSAHSYDSMVEQYEIGPRDPDTGEPLSGKVKITVVTVWNDDTTMAEKNGAVMGLFPTTYAYDGTSAPDMAQAIATGKLDGGNVVFIVPEGATGFIAGIATDGDWIYQTTDADAEIELKANGIYATAYPLDADTPA